MDELVKIALARANKSVEEIPWEEIKKYQATASSSVDFRPYVAKALRSISVLYESLKAI